jgi:Suppressor of fused protein (SUFU)
MREDDLLHDMRRSIILGAFIRAWGLPEFRRVETMAGGPIEVYSFPKSQRNDVHRVVTIGLSGLVTEDGAERSCELIMVFRELLTEDEREIVYGVLLSLSYHSLSGGVSVRPGTVWGVADDLVVPSSWRTRGFLVDRPSEAAELRTFHLGAQHIDLCWMVGIHADERALIEAQGLARFEKLRERAGASLIDQTRRSVVPPRVPDGIVPFPVWARASGFDVRPYEGVGPVWLGMTRVEVRRVLGGRVEAFKKGAEQDVEADAFDALDLNVCYCPDGTVDAVEFFEHAKVSLNGQALIGQPLSVVRAFLAGLDSAELGSGSKPDGTLLTSSALGIGLLVPEITEGPSAIVRGVIFFSQGYFDE